MKNPGQQSLELGLAKVESNNQDWVRKMRGIAKSISVIRGSVSADHVGLRMHGHQLDGPNHPNAWGAIFKGKVAGGHFIQVGMKRSTAKSRNCGKIAVWRWVAAPPTTTSHGEDEETG